MKLLLYPGSNKIGAVIKDFFSDSQYQITEVNLEQFTGLKDFSSYQGILVDKRNWQRNSVLLKYFGTLEKLGKRPLIVFNNEGHSQKLKYREASQPSAICSFSTGREEILNMVGRLVENAEVV